MGMIKFKAPALPLPTKNYDEAQFAQLIRALRIYFQQLDSRTPIEHELFQGGDFAGDTFTGTYFQGRGDKLINPYGAWQSNLTQTNVANTATVMILEQTDYSNSTAITANSKMTAVYPGIYNLQWSGQFQNTDNAQHDINVWIRKNGTDVAGSNGLISIAARKAAGAGNEGHLITGWNYFVQMAANDYIELWWSTSNTAVTLQAYPAGVSPTRPSTASVIATLSFVSALPS